MIPFFQQKRLENDMSFPLYHPSLLSARLLKKKREHVSKFEQKRKNAWRTDNKIHLTRGFQWKIESLEIMNGRRLNRIRNESTQLKDNDAGDDHQ